MALNYPNTPEMLGVIEFGYEGPSFSSGALKTV